MKKNISVIGLGLIGGSMAKALRGFEEYSIIGMDTDEETLEFARVHQVADEVTNDARAALQKADVVFLCLRPSGIISFMEEHAEDFRDGAVITDVAGIKTAVVSAAAALPETVEFIGGHPMAGKEKNGIRHSDGRLFCGAHYIITPDVQTKLTTIELMGRIARHIGCRDLVRTTPEEHDEMIAYTSQVMHILAVAVCDDSNIFRCRGFEGGSFRDCTRVAALDVPLWTELFSMNADALGSVIERLEQNLSTYRKAIENKDTKELTAKLKWSSDRKRRMDLE